MESKPLEIRYTVVKANQLIEASYTLTLAEQRILLACIAQIDSTKPMNENLDFVITAHQLYDLFEIKDSNPYKQLKKGAERLWQQEIKIPGEEEWIRWLDRKKYAVSEGSVRLGFSRHIAPFLSVLTERFTQYKLKYIAKFTSNYSIRIYELLIQWTSAGEREIELNDFREMLCLQAKYKSPSELKRRVIEPSLKDINTHSNLWVKFGQRKRGRTITHLQFQFGLKESKQAKKRITEKDITSAARPGESRPQVIARLSSPTLKPPQHQKT